MVPLKPRVIEGDAEFPAFEVHAHWNVSSAQSSCGPQPSEG